MVASEVRLPVLVQLVSVFVVFWSFLNVIRSSNAPVIFHAQKKLLCHIQQRKLTQYLVILVTTEYCARISMYTAAVLTSSLQTVQQSFAEWRVKSAEYPVIS